MIHQIPARPTMKEAVSHVEARGTTSQKQDIRKARTAFALHGYEGPDFDGFPASLETFELKIKKLSGTMPALQRRIHAAGISDETYRQSWRAGRRLVATVTNAAAEKKERQSQKDAWWDLMNQAGQLVDAGVLRSHSVYALPALADACRALQIAPIGLSADTATTMLKTASRHQRKNLRNGLKVIDQLREIPHLEKDLPRAQVTPPPKPAGRLVKLPLHLQAAINGWVDRAAREQIDDPRYEHLANPLSSSARSNYSSAMSLYVRTLLDQAEELDDDIGLDALFEQHRVDNVLGRWAIEKTHSAHTSYSYAIKLSNILKRNGYPEQGSYVAGLAGVMPYFQEGCAAGKAMSPKVKRWCEALLRNRRKTALFQTQHIHYYRFALEALAAAKTARIDLRAVSEPAQIATLRDADRTTAKALLRRARMFGMLAAYTAIALEGAPYRSKNLLSMQHTGPNKSISLHLSGRDPYAIIDFPNEALKNGKWLSARSEILEPVTIEKRGNGDFGIEILRFYLREIRPLFPEAEKTHCFFPPITAARTRESGFNKGTFATWLAEASAEIGLPLTSHNFRHGYCSIDINEGRRSMEDLAKIMGDTVATIQMFYAWIDGKHSVKAVQQDAARRRAEIMKTRKEVAG